MTAPAFAIGVDIGGTKTALGVVSQTGQILSSSILPTEPERGFERAVGLFAAEIRRLQDEAIRRMPGAECAGIGIGCAGPVDPFRGLINNPYTLTGWDRCDILTPLRDEFGVPVMLENDADAAAMGECWTGAGRGFDPVVMLTFGTGVGGAAIAGGAIQRGVNGEHPELGHIVVASDGSPCYCGTRGCLESVASGTAIGEAGRALGFQDAREVFAAARQGNPEANAIVAKAVEAVKTAIWTLSHALLPQRFVLGGGLMETEYDWFAGALQRLGTATQFTRDAVSLARAELGNAAGLVGAGAIALRAAKGEPGAEAKPGSREVNRRA